MKGVLIVLLKGAGLLGFAAFLGSVFCHLATSVAAGPPGSFAFVLAREQIHLATWSVTMPGLAACVVSALGLCLTGSLSWRQDRRVSWALWLLGLIVANALLVIVPAGEQTLLLARVQADPVRVLAIRNREDVAGGVNVLLTCAVMGLMLRRRSIQAGDDRC